MFFFNFFSKKEDVLASIFKIAEKGMYNIDFPISKEGRFELLMFDIWLGEFLTENNSIYIDYEQKIKSTEEYLKLMASKLGLPPEKKCERIYIFRKDGWMRDIMGLVHSDFPRTKQYLPGYLYLSMISNPLTIYVDEVSERKIDELDTSDLVEFTGPFCEHYSWLVKTITNTIK
ncbi:hypothetical protein H8788_04285 [Parabacteroides faecis]|uniref:hypothetical protein n=1 Tax=Parabacteroides TaxID=375288 RepID=UPI000EFEBF9D|nr:MULTISPECIES: hypothetical protein [Parabacteroides]MBC8616948.1 hypothetical protein [Parabacteroides faecis]RHR94370.1 hypothetical protein DWW23_19370 [Parabacteroides sp. AF14-59]